MTKIRSGLFVIFFLISLANGQITLLNSHPPKQSMETNSLPSESSGERAERGTEDSFLLPSPIGFPSVPPFVTLHDEKPEATQESQSTRGTNAIIQDQLTWELLDRRGQSYRHWWNSTSGTYTYKSDYLVLYQGNWTTYEEYPIRFFVRNLAGTTQFCTLAELVSLFSTYDNQSLWSIGIESFSGRFGFYMNFNDSTYGHGQYLWWPRLRNGSLPIASMPLYQIYPHIYVNASGNMYDKFFIPTATARNRIYLANSSDEISLWYTFQQEYLAKTFQFRMGLKYNRTTRLFHMINWVNCLNGNFDDVGYFYEIDAPPYTRGTPYQPEKFILRNATKSLVLNITDVWDADAYLQDWYSEIEIISESLEAWALNFTDLGLAGFTSQYLKLHDQEMPEGVIRKVLRAGMSGYGSYTQGTLIQIDPTFAEKQTTDEYDFWADYRQVGAEYYATIGSTSSTMGHASYAGQKEIDHAYISWDTGITSTISSTSNANLSFYVSAEELEADEYLSFGLYFNTSLVGGFWNETYAFANPEDAHKQSVDWNDASFWSPSGSGNKSIGDAKTGPLIDQWVTIHNSDPSNRQYIALKINNGTDMDENTADTVTYYESTHATASYRPTLSFDYILSGGNNAPDSPVLGADGGNSFAGKTYGTFKSNHTDSDGAVDIETMYLQFNYTGANITIYCFQNSSSGNCGVETGSGYIIGTPTYSHSAISNGYQVTWSIVFDWDWTADDSTYKTSARTVDDEPEWSAWAVLDSDNTFENDLIIKSISWSGTQFPNGIETGAGSMIDDNEWTKASMQVHLTGVICYQGATTTYPNTDAVDVELWANGSNSGTEDATLGTSGEFDLANITITSVTDTDHDYNITLNDWTGSGAEANYDYSGSETQCSNGVHIDSAVDATNPPTPPSAFCHADAFGDNATEDDDTEIYFDWSNVTDANSGLYTFYAEVNDSTPEEDAGKDLQDTDTAPGAGLQTYYVFAQDNVGNNGSTQSDTITIILSGTAPVLDGAVFTDDGYAPNWYDQGIATIATINVTWHDDDGNADFVWIIVVGIDTYYNSSPSGNWTTFEIAIYEDGDGDYNIKFYVNDTLGSEDNDETGSFGDAPLRLDDTGPTFGSFSLDPDPDGDSTGDGYSPNGLYYDSATIQGDFSGCADAGVGIKYYYIKITVAGSYGSPDADGLNVQATASEPGTLSIRYKIEDQLGNLKSADTTVNVIYGITAPTQDLDVIVLTGAGYLYMVGYTDITTGTMYINSGESATWKHVMDEGGAWGSGGAWFVVFEAGWGLGADYNDSSSPYESDDGGSAYDSEGASEADLYLDIVNQCGVSQRITISTTEDTTAPLIDVTGESESSTYLYAAYGTITQGYYGSTMGSGQSYTVSGTASDAASGQATVVDNSTFGDNPSNSGSATAWVFVYSIDAADNGNVTIKYTATDNVGNTNDSAIYYFLEDNTAPTAIPSAFCHADAFGDNSTTDDDMEIYFDWSNCTDGHSGLANFYAALNDTTPDDPAGKDLQDTDAAELGDGYYEYYVRAMDNVGNYNAIVNDSITIILIEVGMDRTYWGPDEALNNMIFTKGGYWLEWFPLLFLTICFLLGIMLIAKAVWRATKNVSY